MNSTWVTCFSLVRWCIQNSLKIGILLGMFQMSQWLWIRETQQRHHNVIIEFLFVRVFYCKNVMRLCILWQSYLIAEFLVCCTFSLLVMPKSVKYCYCTAAGCLKTSDTSLETSDTKPYLKYHRFPVDPERSVDLFWLSCEFVVVACFSTVFPSALSSIATYQETWKSQEF